MSLWMALSMSSVVTCQWNSVFELHQLVRTADLHACLRESFPRKLQLLLRIVEY
jgi:hypothetical protein